MNHRVAYISDIHGNWPALQAVLNDIDKFGVSEIYCLGDLVGYYAQINEVIDCIRRRGILSCMGNHDYALVKNNGIIARSKTCTNVLTKQLSYISDENKEYLQSLPDKIIIENGEAKILCVHGGINDMIDEYLPQLSDDYFDKARGVYSHIITGHNHIAKVEQFTDVLYGNCGAVGQPRDHDPRASYLVMEDGLLRIRRVEYNIDQTRAAMREYGFEDYISDVLYKGCKIGE